MDPRTDRMTRIPSGVASPVTTNHAAKGSVFVNLSNVGNLKGFRDYHARDRSLGSAARTSSRETALHPHCTSAVQGSGLRVQGSGCRVQGSGSRARAPRLYNISYQGVLNVDHGPHCTIDQ